MTKATVHYTGRVRWEPPAIYKSMCQIDVEWFPFDEQTCQLKFGSWTYDGHQVDLLHMIENKSDIVHYGPTKQKTVECIELGIDLSDYYASTEWEIIAVPGRKNKEVYPCCPFPYIDITYDIHLRRKTLFYTVNLILPCIGISFLTILVFYLPSDSGEKVTLSISILISLTVFFLLLVEIIPSTSLVVPLIGKYLLFTMVLVTLSICITVVVINFHFRSPRTHSMSVRVRKWFLEILPKYLYMQRPHNVSQSIRIRKASTRIQPESAENGSVPAWQRVSGRNRLRSARLSDTPPIKRHFWKQIRNKQGKSGAGKASRNRRRGSCVEEEAETEPMLFRNVNAYFETELGATEDQFEMSEDIQQAIAGVQYIGRYLRKEDESEEVMEDWKFVAMVIDRLFLVLFSLACIVGATSIILQAPTLYDRRRPIDSEEGDPKLIHEQNLIKYCQANS